MAITIAEINANSIQHNLKMLKQQSNDIPILAMVKADGYGHSMLKISRLLRSEKIEYLGVALIHEALKIRQSGDNGKILVMVSPEPSDADLFIDFNVETAFSSFEILTAFEKRAKERDAVIIGHLYIDTGMHRDGMPPEEALAFMDYIKDKPNIKIVGLMTHLATADMPEIDFTDKQLETFENIRKKLDDAGYHFKYIHSANSSATLNYANSHYNMIRPGIAIYGYMPNENMAKKMNLIPSLKWKSKVMFVKKVPKGGFIGYGMSFIAPREMTIAVVPIGYGDGLPKNLTNKFECLINGKRYKSVGSVCMDEFMVDISDSNIKLGDEVVILGKQGNEEITVYELANLSNSIPHAITTSITKRVKRIIINE
jgi:alanine racemase